MNIDALIQAYQQELSGYIRRGLRERAKSVEAEPIRLGGSISSPPVEIVPIEPDSTSKRTSAAAKKPAKKKRES